MHGLIHLMGFAKAYHLAPLEQLTQAISKPWGVLWLLAAALFVAVSAIRLANADWWWIVALLALLLSQVLVSTHWPDAKVGTLPNIIVLLVAFVGFGEWRFNRMVDSERNALMAGSAVNKGKVLTADDLEALPPIVHKWVQRSGVVGREAARTVHVRQRGRLRTSRDGRWMPFRAEQWFATNAPGFLWVADVQALPGVHLAGRDTYIDGQGHMRIELLSLFAVADARGQKIDQGSLLRYLGETVWFPSAATAPYI